MSSCLHNDNVYVRQVSSFNPVYHDVTQSHPGTIAIAISIVFNPYTIHIIKHLGVLSYGLIVSMVNQRTEFLQRFAHIVCLHHGDDGLNGPTGLKAFLTAAIFVVCTENKPRRPCSHIQSQECRELLLSHVSRFIDLQLNI